MMERLNRRQKNRLIDLMSRHYDVLFGRFVAAHGTQIKSRIWRQIHTELNCLGPEKSLDQWKRCWRDLKKGAKSKLFQVRKYREKSGGGGDTCPIWLTDHEQIIISICNFNELDELQGQELGINQTPPHSSHQNHSVYLSPSNNDSFYGFPRISNNSGSQFNSGIHSQSPTLTLSSNQSSNNSGSQFNSGIHSQSPTLTLSSNQSSNNSGSQFNSGIRSQSPTLTLSSNQSSMSRNRSHSDLKKHAYRRRNSSESELSDVSVERQPASTVRTPISKVSVRQQPTTPIRQIISEVPESSSSFTSPPLSSLRGQPWSVWISSRSTERTIDLTDNLKFPQDEYHQLRAVSPSSSTRNRNIDRNSNRSGSEGSSIRDISEKGCLSNESYRSINSGSHRSRLTATTEIRANKENSGRLSKSGTGKCRSSNSKMFRNSRISTSNKSNRNTHSGILSSMTGNSCHSLSNEFRYSHQNSSSNSNRSTHSGIFPSRESSISGIRVNNKKSGSNSLSSETVYRGRSEIHSELNRSIGRGSYPSRLTSISGSIARSANSISNGSNGSSYRSAPSLNLNVSSRRTNSTSRQSSSNCSYSHRSNSMVSSRSFLSDTDSLPQGESRRNLTGTLARSVQNAAIIQENIERNILQLRDGQTEIVNVLGECLKELQRANDLRN